MRQRGTVGSGARARSGRRGEHCRHDYSSGWLTLRVVRQGRTTVLAAFGEWDVAGTRAFRAAVREALAADLEHLVVDLSGLDLITTDGVHALLELANRGDEAFWHLRLLRAPAAVQRVFELTGTDPLLPFAD